MFILTDSFDGFQKRDSKIITFIIAISILMNITDFAG